MFSKIKFIMIFNVDFKAFSICHYSIVTNINTCILRFLPKLFREYILTTHVGSVIIGTEGLRDSMSMTTTITDIIPTVIPTTIQFSIGGISSGIGFPF